VVYARSDDNLDRIARALRPLAPYPRGAPPGLPFDWSTATLKRGLNFTLTSRAGSLDLRGGVGGGGSFGEWRATSRPLRTFGRHVRVLDLDALIRAKRAAGRPKDYEALAELELLRELGQGK